ncbi:hypothetical protein MMC30_009349 [Trapelia coarctata]|nr:hypothetical protein [Trapelia coarctata]
MAGDEVTSTISQAECGDGHVASTKPMQDDKALPRLPRGWSRVCHETSLFLRGIGLGIIVTAFHGFTQKNFSEPKKIAIHQSRITALLRSLVHIAPIAVALFEIVINWQGRYVGAVFDKQSYYQFAAKVHEISMQASLASIVLSSIRFEVALGDGLPFGAFLGGLQFLQPTYFYVNGTSQDIWPNNVDGIKVPEECAVFNGSAVNPLCPASDFGVILLDINDFVSTNLKAFDSNGPVVPQIALPASEGPWTRVTLVRLCYNSLRDQSCASVPHDIIMEGAFYDETAWTLNALESSPQPSFTDIIHTITKDYSQAYTVASCVADTINGATDQALLRFARISETESELKRDRDIVSIPNLPKASILAGTANASEFRLKWVPLPPNIFNHGALGAVLLHPQQPSSESLQNITTCTLSAGWGTSSVGADLLRSGAFFATITGVPNFFPTFQEDATRQLPISRPDFANISSFAYPQQRMEISEKWAEFLNPTIELPDGTNTTAIHQYFSISPSVLGEVGTSRIMAVILSAGLSRIGKELQVSGLPNKTSPCQNCTVFEVQHSFVGWVYSIDGTLTTLAIVVMFAYCILAFAHTIYLGIFGVSSGAWDSLADLVALAMNSAPTKHLQNTCAGIYGVKTFQTHVQLLAVPNGDGDYGHLELVFGDNQESHADAARVAKNTEYGTLHLKEE